MKVRTATADDIAWAVSEADPIGGRHLVSERRVHDLAELPGLISLKDRIRVGFLLWRADEHGAEIVGLRATDRFHGIGTALLEAFFEAACVAGHRSVRVWTTNDNVDALRFYQRRGFVVTEYRIGGMDEVLMLKGFVPDEITGRHGIPVRDTIRLDCAVPR